LSLVVSSILLALTSCSSDIASLIV
jgi:hypothetical protein